MLKLIALLLPTFVYAESLPYATTMEPQILAKCGAGYQTSPYFWKEDLTTQTPGFKADIFMVFPIKAELQIEAWGRVTFNFNFFQIPNSEIYDVAIVREYSVNSACLVDLDSGDVVVPEFFDAYEIPDPAKRDTTGYR